MIALSVVFVLVNVIVLFLGFLIRNKGMTWLIAGYDASAVRDEHGLARWVGSGVMAIGALGVIVGASLPMFPDHAHILVITFVVVATGGTLALMVGGRRFLKRK